VESGYRQLLSGPFMPESAEGASPEKTVIDRTSINSWLNADSRAAVAATGRKRIVLAGLWTGACVNFPALEYPASRGPQGLRHHAGNRPRSCRSAESAWMKSRTLEGTMRRVG
jgi:hypothetical protein